MSAYACEPHRGSEPGVGWNWAVQAAKHHEVWVLTRRSNQKAIETELAERPVPNLHPMYHDLPRWLQHRDHRSLWAKCNYVLWQLTVLTVAKAQHQAIEFDVVHHLTFNSIDMPGILWLLGKPFIWGPVGGAQVPPVELKDEFRSHWWRQRVRMLQKKALRINPFTRLAVMRNHALIAANADAVAVLKRLGATHPILRLEAGVARTQIRTQSKPRVSDPRLEILWAGELVHRKGPFLAVDAVNKALKLNTPLHLTMVGDGPLQHELSQYILDAGMTTTVSLVGRVPFAEMKSCYDSASLFLFTSVQDTSGNVVLEAMASGLPVVTLDHQGAAAMVSDDAGIRVAVRSRQQVVEELGRAINTLWFDTHMRASMGDNARALVLDRHTWDRTGDFLRDLYQTGGSTIL
jgi:glycosyltransferase involved in cell wall biosynthesis